MVNHVLFLMKEANGKKLHKYFEFKIFILLIDVNSKKIMNDRINFLKN